MNTAKKSKTYECKKCHAKFSQKQGKSRHAKHCGEKSILLSCDRYSFATKRKDGLVRHQHKCIGKKSDKTCPICSKVFIANSHVLRHMKVHSQEVPYRCEFCDGTCKRADHFRNHQENCSKSTKSFSCVDCGKCFRLNRSLKQHQKHCNENSSLFDTLSTVDTDEFRCCMAFDAQVVPSFENPISSTFSQQSAEILSSEKHCDFDITSTSSCIDVSAVY